MKTRKLKSLGLDEAIKVNTLAQAKWFIERLGWCEIPPAIVGKFITRNEDGCFSWTDSFIIDVSVVPASDFIKPKKSKFKKFEKRVEALESVVKDAAIIAFDSVIKDNINSFQKGLKKLNKSQFQVGKWYKCDFFDSSEGINRALYFIEDIKDEDIIGFGFDYKGNWHNSTHFGNISGSDVSRTEATPEEVESALIKEAERRGFKKGITFKNAWSQHQFNEEKIETSDKGILYIDPLFFTADQLIYLDDNTIFYNGKWAEILPNEEETIDWSKAGQLVESEYHIVVTTGNHDDKRFEGILLKSLNGSISSAIEKRNNYSKGRFKPFKGELTLKNE